MQEMVVSSKCAISGYFTHHIGHMRHMKKALGSHEKEVAIKANQAA